MCGLVGIMSSNMFQKHQAALAELLYLDTWRGHDSTGVAAIRKNGDTATLKYTVPGYDFISLGAFRAHLHLTDNCWIGHNRYGTVGKNIKTNAHPFEVLDEDGSCILVGAHNGTLRNKHQLKDADKFGTDSEALYNQIARTTVEETIPLLEGAWALTYFDHLQDELRFIRNKERTLFFCFEKGKKTLLWASEAWMLRIVCSRNDIEIENGDVFTCAEDTLYCFPCPSKINEEISYTKHGGLAGKAPAFFQASQQARTGGQTTPPQKAQTTLTVVSSQSGTKTTAGGGTPHQQSLSHSNGSSGNVYVGYGGKRLTKVQLDNDLEGGCGWCQTENITAESRYGWIAEGVPVCRKCLNGTEEPTKQVQSKKVATIN